MNIYIIIVLIIIIIFFKYIYNDDRFKIFEDSVNKPVVIPLNIYQTWKTKELPPKMKECVEKLKNNNPEFNHYLYDDGDCLEFIKENFSQDVVDAYNNLIPGAYKADLWRYCILYIKGGIYLDIKYYNILPFKLINLTDKEYFVRDLKTSGGGIYNAVMICKQGNEKLKRSIDQIVNNSKNNFYGSSCLEPTGPMLLKNIFTSKEINELELYLSDNKYHCPYKHCIYYKKYPILTIYNEYYETSELGSSKMSPYGVLWGEQKVYKNKVY